MFQHHTRYPLHRALEHNCPQLVKPYLKEAKDQKELCNRTNQRGLTVLQMSAMEGHRDLIRTLLLAGADINKTSEVKDEDPEVEKTAQKSPLYLAVERGHKTIAHFLLLCGADKNAAIATAKEFKQQDVLEELEKLQIDTHLSKGILRYEMIKESSQSLLKEILDNLDAKYFQNEIPQLIQYCLRFQNLKEILPRLKQAGNVSAQDYELLELINLYHFEPLEFDRRTTSLSPQQFEKLEKYIYFEHKELSHRQQFIYESASNGNQVRLKMLCGEDKDVAAVISYACKMSHWTVMEEIRRYFDGRRFLEIALDYKLPEVIKFLIADIDEYQFVVAYQGHRPRFESLLSVVGAQSILHKLVSRCMGQSADAPFSSQEKSLFFLFRQQHELFANVFLRCLADRYPDKRLAPLLAMQNQTLTKRLDDVNLYSYNELIETNLQRLNYPLPKLAHTPPLSRVGKRNFKLTDFESNFAKQQILPFFSLNEIKTLSRTCKTMNKWPAKFSVTFEQKLSADKEMLTRQYQRVKRFLGNVKQEIRETKIDFWEKNNVCIIWEAIAFVISTPLFATAAANIKSTFDTISRLKSGLFDIHIPANSSLAHYGPNCGEAFLYTWYCETTGSVDYNSDLSDLEAPRHYEAYPWTMMEEPCGEPCTQLYHQNGLAVAEIFSILLLGPTALGTFITLISLLSCYSCERDKIQTYDLSKFSHHLQAEYDELRSLRLLDSSFRTEDSKRKELDYWSRWSHRYEYDHPRPSVRIDDVILQAQTAMSRIKEQIREVKQQIKHGKGLNYVIEVKDEKEVKRNRM